MKTMLSLRLLALAAILISCRPNAVLAQTITTVAGNGINYSGSYSGDGGAATSAGFDPLGVATDAAGNVYIVDYTNHRIRKVAVATGIITTIAGNGTPAFSGDGGAATSATLNYPNDIALDGAGNIYFSDEVNNRVRKITAATGIITTVAGGGGLSTNGVAATSAFIIPRGICLDAAGNIYIAENGLQLVRKVTVATGLISTVAGNGTSGFSGDGGAATSANLNQPYDVAVDGTGNIFITDQNNNRIRKVTVATGVISTIAGNGAATATGDGSAASSATTSSPTFITVDGAGNIFFGSAFTAGVRKITASSGIITTVAGNGTFGTSGDNGPATSAQVGTTYGLVIDGSGSLYIGDYSYKNIRKVTNAGSASSCTPPSFTVCPTNISTSSASNSCSAAVTFTATATGTPAPTLSWVFAGATIGSGPNIGSGRTFNKGVTTVTLTATNGCSPDATCSFTVTVADTTKPVFAAVNNITAFSVGNTCGTNVNYPIPAFTDNCPGCVPAVPSNYIYLGAFGGHSYYKSPSSDDWNNFEGFAFGLGGYLATINSAAENAFLSSVVSGPAWIGFTDKVTEGTFRWSNGEPVTYTNWCGGSPSGTANTSQDYGIINGGAGGCWADQYSCCFPAIIEFNCSPFAERISGPASGGFFPIGSTTVTYRATDPSGNSSTTSFTVTVMDTVKPVLSQVINMTAYCNANNCGTAVTYAVPTFSDNCPSCVAPVPSNYTYLGTFGGHTYYKSPSSDDWNNFEGFAFGLGGYLATINSAAENAFLSSVVSGPAWIGFTDKVTEGTFRWSNGEPVTYTNWCGGSPSGTANTSQDYGIINGGAGGCWADQYSCCFPAIIEFNCSPFCERTAGPASGGFFPIGTTTVSYKATDLSGNISTTSFTVTVMDTIKPVLSPVNNITTFGGPPTCAAVVNYPIPTFSDNCPACVAPIPSSYTYLGTFGGHTYYKSPSSDDWNNFEGFAFGLGGYLATINSAAENAFLSSVVSGPAWIGFTDKVTEGTFRWSNGEPVTYTNWCSGMPSGTANTSQDYGIINGGAGGCWADQYSCCFPAIIEFNCSPLAQRIAGPASGSSFPVGTTTVTYKATDPSGNISTTSFTVTVVDSTHTCGVVARPAGANGNVSAGEVKVYPNPNSGSFIVELPAGVDNAQVVVTDVQGKVIARKIATESYDSKIRFELGDVARGVYFVEVIYSDQRFRAKLIIQ